MLELELLLLVLHMESLHMEELPMTQLTGLGMVLELGMVTVGLAETMPLRTCPLEKRAFFSRRIQSLFAMTLLTRTFVPCMELMEEAELHVGRRTLHNG
jgi:hypothetical protein